MNFESRISPQPDGDVREHVLFQIRAAGRTFARGTGIWIDKLDIPAGRILAILGATGSGKSTLLNLLGGLEVPRAAGADAKFVFSLPRRKPVDLLQGRGLGAGGIYVGFVFQSGHLMRDATVSANIAVSPAAAHLPIDYASIEALCSQLRLRNGIVADRARVLSGGEAQRVAVGRALLRDPDLVLADEPTAGLDPAHGTQVMATLAAWQRSGNGSRSLVWITHNYEEAAKFADEIIVLRNGEIASAFHIPRDNPADPSVLKAWVDGRADARADPAIVAQIRAEAAKALDGYAIGSAGTTTKSRAAPWQRLTVASKLAAAELLSKPAIDADKPPRAWLERLTSFSRSAPHTAGAGFFREAIWWRSCGILAAAVASLVAGSDVLSPLYAFLVWILSIVGAAVAIFWPAFRRVEGLGQVTVYMVLLMAVTGLEQGRRLLDASFSRKLNTPELSHLVLNGSRIGKQLTPEELTKIGCAMESKHLAAAAGEPADAPCKERRELVAGSPFPPNNTIFGRWDTRGIAVARRTSRESPDAEQACRSAQAIGNFAAIVADPNEPVFKIIGTDLVPPDGNALIRVGNLDLTRGAIEDIASIGVSRAFAVNALDFRNDATRDPFICVKFRNWQVVRIAHVLDQLPNDGETEYQMLFPPPVHFEAVRARYDSPQVQKRMLAAYDTAAIYLDGGNAQSVKTDTATGILDYVSDLVTNNGNASDGLSTEPGFRKIKAAVEGWVLSQGIAWVAILGALGLSSILIVVSMVNRITENDKALCVMRAFGMKFADVFLFVFLQAVIFFVVGGALGLLVAYLGWPLIVPRIAGALDIVDGASGPGSVLLRSYPLFALAVIVSCLVATGYWWRKSKQIAQRLQRLA
jgi:putative ABC transport system ATP-binding protein